MWVDLRSNLMTFAVSCVLLLLCTTANPLILPARLEVAWRTELQVISSVNTAGDDDEISLVYVLEEGDVYIVALESYTGNEMWREVASYGAIHTSQRLYPQVLKGYVVYFRPTGDNMYSQLIIADPLTGEDFAYTDSMLFTSQPSTCGDNTRTVCVIATPSEEESTSGKKVVIADGGLRSISPHGTGGRVIGVRQLTATNVNGTEYISVRDPRGLAHGINWRFALDEEINDGRTYNTRGWRWEYEESMDAYFGDITFSESGSLDFGFINMMRIGREGGNIVWIEEGASAYCGNTIQIPMHYEDDLPDHLSSVGATLLPVRCRSEGTLRSFIFDEDSSSEVLLEGYDPETGDTTWRISMPESMPLFGKALSEQPVIRSGQSSIIVESDGGMLSVDLATGETRSPTRETLWCGMESSFEYDESYAPLTDIVSDSSIRFADLRYFWCDPSGDPVDGRSQRPNFVPFDIGAQVGPLTLVSEGEEVVAYYFDY